MTQDTNKFEVNEVFKRNWLILVIFLAVVWIGSAIVFYLDDRVVERWAFFLIPISYTLLPIFNVVRYGRDIYEISDNNIVKKRARKVLRSVECKDVVGFKSQLPIRLKLSGQKDFVFYGIVVKSTRKRLLTVLREIGVSELPKPPRFTPLQSIILVGSVLSIVHFFISIVAWILGSKFLFKHTWVDIDWFMFLHSIPPLMLLGASILSLALVIKRSRKTGLIFLVTLILSVSCGVLEISNHCYNSFGKKEYFTWWWYGLHEPKSEETPSTHYRSKYGFINKSGEIVIEPQFDTVSEFSEGMAYIGFRYEIDPNEISKSLLPGMPLSFAETFFGDTLKYGYKYGYINKKGDILVEPIFDDAEEFSEGLACVAVGDIYGYINKEGEIVIKPQFDYAWSFYEDRAKIEIDEKFGYIDKTGTIIIHPQFSRARHFSEDFAVVEINDKSGYINKAGQVVIEPEFDNAGNFSEGLAVIRIGERFGYIDKTGQVIIEPQFDYAYTFAEGLAVVDIDIRRKFDQQGYIDRSGSLVIEPKYSRALPFREGIASVCMEKGWGYRYKAVWQCIDKDGKTIDKPYLDEVRIFYEGLSKVWVDNKYGYIDKNGTLVIKPQFESAGGFSEGLASVGMRVEEK